VARTGDTGTGGLNRRFDAARDRLLRARRDARAIRRAAAELLLDPSLDGPRMLRDLVTWRLDAARRDLDFRPDGLPGPGFCSAREAIALIRNGDTVASSGFAASGRCAIFFDALREAYAAGGSPSGLRWITVSAQGGRGRLGETIEELALPGLLDSYICGHLETARALLELADRGELALHTLPQGVMTRLLAGQGEGRRSLLSHVGLGTFLDPRHGGGTAVTAGARGGYVRAEHGRLRYRLPPVRVAMLSAGAADRDGNLYFDDDPTVSENVELARAARRNGGRVLAVVGRIVERRPRRHDLPRRLVDRIVVDPHREQIAGVLQRDRWAMFLPDAPGDLDAALHHVRALNTLLGATPRRSDLDRALARVAATRFVAGLEPGSLVNIGIGLPEEVCWLLYETGLYRDLTLSTESGVLGGVPLGGLFFGAAAAPQAIGSSVAMFRRYRRGLDGTVLGFLQVDSAGNVNVSKRGERVVDFVGPGGFCDISCAARRIVFVGSWMVGGRMRLDDGQLRIERRGRCKFVDRVAQVTFDGQRALRAGKSVFYVSNVGVFELTRDGLTLRLVAPGVDIDNDILAASSARIVVPSRVARVPRAQMTGHRFTLRWP
jgi:propionate CoA-transferase